MLLVIIKKTIKISGDKEGNKNFILKIIKFKLLYIFIIWKLVTL